MHGARGDPERARGMSTTPSSAARAAPRTHAAAWPASAAAPEGLHCSNPTQRCGTTLWAHTGGATTSSLPRFSGCDAWTVVLFSPPRDDFPVLDDPCKLLIENT